MGGNKYWVLRSDDGKCQKRGAILLARNNGGREGLEQHLASFFCVFVGGCFVLESNCCPLRAPSFHSTLFSIMELF